MWVVLTFVINMNHVNIAVIMMYYVSIPVINVDYVNIPVINVNHVNIPVINVAKVNIVSTLTNNQSVTLSVSLRLVNFALYK